MKKSEGGFDYFAGRQKQEDIGDGSLIILGIVNGSEEFFEIVRIRRLLFAGIKFGIDIFR